MKLIVNFLFYFRPDEDEVSVGQIWSGSLQHRGHYGFVFQPAGALLLEQCRVEREDQQAFSIGERYMTTNSSCFSRVIVMCIYYNVYHISVQSPLLVQRLLYLYSVSEYSIIFQ